MPGGATILGADGPSDYVPGVRFTLPPNPARFFATSTFLVDRDEVTVGRYRNKAGPSWRGGLPRPNDGPLATDDFAELDAPCWRAHLLSRGDMAR